MTNWFAAHWGDLVVGGVLLLVLGAVVFGMVKRRRSGGGCCGCACHCGKDDRCGR